MPSAPATMTNRTRPSLTLRRERREELEFQVRQLDRLAVDGDGASHEVDADPVHLDHIAAACHGRKLGAPELRAHPAPKFPHRERLRDVVVGAELEPDDLVELVTAGGE